MELLRALRLNKNPGESRITFVGARGKTTALFQLARELTPPVIIASTTHFGAWQVPLADRHIIAASPEQIGEIGTGVTLVSGPVENERTTPVNSDVLLHLRNLARGKNIPILLECDGARGLPIKAPAEHEPPIPDFVESVVVVAGLSGLGKPITDEFVFRENSSSKSASQ